MDTDSKSKVLLYVESRYQVSRKRIVQTVLSVLKEQSIAGDVEVSVAIVGDRKMRALHKKYKGEDRTTNVLSFSLSEGDQTVVPSEVLHLGDVVISYPQIIKESAEEEMLVDDKIDELVKHGTLHLLGIDH